MFPQKTPVEKSGLEMAIDDILAQMDHCDSASSDEYSALSSQLQALYKLKEIDYNVMTHTRVSADTAVKTGGLLLGIGIIVAYEQKAVMTSKALSFLQKLL